MSATVLVTVPRWLARNEGYVSCELEGEIVERRGKGVHFIGHASVRESDNCLRCGTPITNPVSRLAGYGPYCSDVLGIPRVFAPEDIERIRAQVRATEIDVWLPAGRILVNGGPAPAEVAAPTPAPAAPTGPPPKPLVEITVDGDLLVVRSPIEFKDALKAIPGRRWAPREKRPPSGAWTFPASPQSAQAIADVFRPHTARLEIRADAATKDLRRQHDAQHAAQAHKRADELPPVPCSATTAWLHQQQAYWFVESLPAAMLAMDMGTGKSKVVVDVIVNDPTARRVLVVCPKSVVGVWPREFERHAGRPVTVVAPRKGPRGGPLSVAKRAAEIEQALRATRDGETVVVVVNYESAWRMESVLLRDWDAVVLDESHRIKKPGGKASMFCAKLRKHSRRRLALTGTPMPHSPLDVYAQFRFLDPGVFGTSFAAFRSRYAVMGGYGGHEVLGYQRQDELAERMYRIAFRVMAGDVLDLPPATHVQRTTELSAAAMKVYRELSSKMIAEIGDGVVSASNVLVKLLRLQQITSGWLPLDDVDEEGDREWVQVDTAKRDLFADVIADLPEREPIVVACRFSGDLDNVRLVAESQGRRYAELSGRRRDGLADDATMHPDVDVLGVQIQSGGVGIDLTRAHYAVNYSVGYSLGDWEQWIKRVDRPGQAHPVTFYNLACEDTVDERIYEALRARKNLVEFVLGLND